jgi:hypothetical protein
VFAAETTFSSIISEPKSLQPKRSAVWPDLHSHRHPAGLDVGDVVSTTRAKETVRQVVTGVRLRHVRHARRVLRLERPADERRESLRALLHLAHPLQVLEALGERLADAVHHGDGGLHPLLVRDLHDLEPPVGARLLLRDLVAHALHEISPPPPGIESRARLLELADAPSRASMRYSFDQKSTSLGLNPWTWIGWLRLM